MKFPLVLAGILFALTGCVWWAASGAHKGWTKTSLAVEKVDEITGIPYREYEKRFIPGVEFPVAAVGIGSVLIGIGIWRNHRHRLPIINANS